MLSVIGQVQTAIAMYYIPTKTNFQYYFIVNENKKFSLAFCFAGILYPNWQKFFRLSLSNVIFGIALSTF